ncbi:MAG: hypothetical protein Q4B73_03320 [Lachnospiraceae bacterium]|nr:hypothetical protein [Lachnospiraceae bacterium]
MKKNIKRVVAILLAVAVLIGAGKTLRYALHDDANSYSRLLFHQFYQMDDNIDTIFVGSSHVYRSLNPVIADDLLEANTFNLGTSGQMMDGSYAMIREACAHHDVKTVYLELYYGIAEEPDPQDRTQNTATYKVADYMKPSLRKLSYLLKASSPDYYDTAFVVARRNWEKLFEESYLRHVYKSKQTDEYKNYTKTDMDEGHYYVGKGFFTNDGCAEDTYLNTLAYEPILALDMMNEAHNWYQSIQDIVDYCRKHKIELVFFVAPEPEGTLVGKGNYAAYHDRLKDISEEMDVPLYDFNLCKPAYFDTNDRSLFLDEDHLNSKGADAFTTLFAQFFTGRISEEALFFNTFEDKMMAEEPTVYGIAGFNEEVMPDQKAAFIIANRTEGLEYRVTATPSESKEPRLIQDYSPNTAISVPKEESGTLTVEWRKSGSSEAQAFEVPY